MPAKVLVCAAIAGVVIPALVSPDARGEVPSGPEATPLNARVAVARSLPFIEKVGTAWIAERKCNSCHAVTFLVWSHNAAALRGFDVDRKKLAEWVDWSLSNSLADNYWFRLRPRAMEALKAGGMPEALLAKLNPLAGKTYTKQKEYLDALEKALGREDFERHQESLIREAALPNNGGGPDTLAQHLLARAPTIEDKVATERYRAIRSLLLEWQELDGSWLAQGQLPELKWAAKEMNDATTMWSLLALSTATAPNDVPALSRARALDSLKNATPGESLQSLALHVIIARQFGEPARAEALMKDLLARQNADGGWSWTREKPESEAFSTGHALYALGRAGRNGNDPAVRRAWEFLLRTQGKDGGWEVPQDAVNRRPRKLNVYPLWGTAWATIGILQTLPPR